MRKIYNLLFAGTYIIISKSEKYNGSSAAWYNAVSTVMFLVVTHFLFVFGSLVLVAPKDFDISIVINLCIITFFVFLFWFMFIKNSKYETLIEEHRKENTKALWFSILVNSAMLIVFFAMAIFEIYKAM
ncbi:hypothetical protein BGP75_18685 [Motiliproteus sp. MSK22-1]|nr:hypothetical protein BGP75_18685 [Motiliproteus sp. MSK22-1]